MNNLPIDKFKDEMVPILEKFQPHGIIIIFGFSRGDGTDIMDEGTFVHGDAEYLTDLMERVCERNTKLVRIFQNLLNRAHIIVAKVIKKDTKKTGFN